MKHKPVILFIVKFFATYLIFSLLYSYFLNHTKQREVDRYTEHIAYQSVKTGHIFGLDFRTEPHDTEASMKLFYKNHYTARVVEGCNAISVLILFWAFIIAFSGSLKNTVLFGVLGSAIIYVFNLARIVFLTKAMYDYPKYNEVLHQVIFPAVIYGVTFTLWIIWVRYLAKK